MIADTCHSESLYKPITSPNVLATSSSLEDEESTSYHMDWSIGVHTVDEYAYFAGKFLDAKVKDRNSTASMMNYLDSCPPNVCHSNIGKRYDLFKRDPTKVPVLDFFGSKKYTKASTSTYSLLEDTEEEWDKVANIWNELGKDRHLEY